MAIVANNGSGKSQMIVAPSAIWLCMARLQAQCVITSASGDQIDNQVSRALNNVCLAINRIHKREVWKVNYRHYECLDTGSMIDLYATDEPAKAEGYHPICIGGEFAIFVDEAKSVHQSLYEAISRCTGCTRRIDVSSPGAPSGHFHMLCTSPSEDIWFKKVTYLDCPRHVKQKEVERAKRVYGESSPFFRSAFLAEFTSVGEQTVMTYENVVDLFNAIKSTPPRTKECPKFLLGKRYAGLDLSLGGDESVFIPFEGNVQLAVETFRFSDANEVAAHCIQLFQKYKVEPEWINADDGGAGRAIIDIIWRQGYSINRVLNQHAALNKFMYGNRGAEMWFSVARYIQEKYLILLDDETTRQQLAFRYWVKHKTNDKIVLESKEDARSKGRRSPDRADALVLAFARFPFHMVYDMEQGESVNDAETKIVNMTQDQIVAMMDRYKFDGNQSLRNSGESGHKGAYGLLNEYYAEDQHIIDIVNSSLASMQRPS
jgi:hypothetical protein